MDDRFDGMRARIFVAARGPALRALGAQLEALQHWALNLAGRHPARGPAQPYVWTRQPPRIRVRQPRSPDAPGELLISVRTDGATEDDYVLAFLVHTLTSTPAAAILAPVAQIHDKEGEFLLVDAAEAAESHPQTRWLTPDAAAGRVWIANARLHIVCPATVCAVAAAAGVDPAELAACPSAADDWDAEPPPTPAVRKVLVYLASNPPLPAAAPSLAPAERAAAEQNAPPLRADVGNAIVRCPAWSQYTLAPPEVEASAFSRILPPTPEDAQLSLPLPPALHVARSTQHVTLALVSPLVARVLRADPQAVSTAAHVFLARDRHEQRHAHRMARFGTGTSLYLPPVLDRCVCELIEPQAQPAREPAPRPPPPGLAQEDIEQGHAVLVPVGMSKRLYAKLVDEMYVPPPAFGRDWVDGVVAYHQLRRHVITQAKGLCRTLNMFRQRHYEVGRWMDLGTKITVGMEIAYATSLERRARRHPSVPPAVGTPPSDTTEEQRTAFASGLQALGYVCPSAEAVEHAIARAPAMEASDGDAGVDLDAFAPFVDRVDGDTSAVANADLSAVRPVEQCDFETSTRWFEASRVCPFGTPPGECKSQAQAQAQAQKEAQAKKEEEQYTQEAEAEAQAMLNTLGEQMDQFLHRQADYRGATFDDEADEEDQDEDDDFSTSEEDRDGVSDDSIDAEMMGSSFGATSLGTSLGHVPSPKSKGSLDLRARQAALEQLRALDPAARAEAQKGLVAPLEGKWGAGAQLDNDEEEHLALTSPPQALRQPASASASAPAPAELPLATPPASQQPLLDLAVPPLSPSQSQVIAVQPLGAAELAALFPRADGAGPVGPVDTKEWRPSGFTSAPAVAAAPRAASVASTVTAPRNTKDRPSKKTRPNPGPTAVGAAPAAAAGGLARGFLNRRPAPHGTKAKSAAGRARADEVQALRASIRPAEPYDGAEDMASDDDGNDDGDGRGAAKPSPSIGPNRHGSLLEDGESEGEDALPDAEVDAFLRFAVEQLGINEEQYNAIVAERRAKGAYVPGDHTASASASAAGPKAAPASVLAEKGNKGARTAAGLSSAPPPAPTQIDTFDQLMDTMDAHLANAKATAAMSGQQPRASATGRPAHDSKGTAPRPSGSAPPREARPPPSSSGGKGKARVVEAQAPECDSDSDMDVAAQDAEVLAHLSGGAAADEVAALAALASRAELDAHAGAALGALDRPGAGPAAGAATGPADGPMLGVQALLARLRESRPQVDGVPSAQPRARRSVPAP